MIQVRPSSLCHISPSLQASWGEMSFEGHWLPLGAKCTLQCGSGSGSIVPIRFHASWWNKHWTDSPSNLFVCLMYIKKLFSSTENTFCGMRNVFFNLTPLQRISCTSCTLFGMYGFKTSSGSQLWDDSWGSGGRAVPESVHPWRMLDASMGLLVAKSWQSSGAKCYESYGVFEMFRGWGRLLSVVRMFLGNPNSPTLQKRWRGDRGWTFGIEFWILLDGYVPKFRFLMDGECNWIHVNIWDWIFFV